jgi:hypothetical protein
MIAALDIGQVRFDPLDWEDRQNCNAEQARKEALAARAIAVKEAKKQGFKTKCWTLTNQLRQYKSMGQSDGRVRSVYYLNLSKD